MSSSSISSSEQSDVSENGLLFPIVVCRRLFSYFSPREICSTVAPVCKAWFDLSREAHLWRRLSLRDPDSFLMVKLIRDARAPLLSHLRTLNIDGWSEQGDVIVALVTVYCPLLEQLHLSGADAALSLKALDILAEKCAELTSLRATAYTDLTTFPHFRNLTDLDISSVQLEREQDVNIFDHCTRLTSLRVVITPPIGEGFADRFEQFLAKNVHRLVGLNLCDWRGSVQESCYTNVARCENITELALTGAYELRGDALIAMLTGLTQLKKLQIVRAPRLTGPEIIAALIDKSRLKHLESLGLFEMAVVTDWAVIRITKRFETQLNALWLGGCWRVTDTGLHNILTLCTELHTLCVDSLFRLTDETVLQIPVRLTKLTSLDVRNCNITQDTVDALTNAMPNAALLTLDQ